MDLSLHTELLGILRAANGAGHLAVQPARLHDAAARLVAAASDPSANGPFLHGLSADALIG